MDPIGWFIATLHQVLGHDKAAALLEQPPYNKNACVLCLFEQGKATKDEVIAAIGRGKES
jgi:hypothetical protein